MIGFPVKQVNSARRRRRSKLPLFLLAVLLIVAGLFYYLKIIKGPTSTPTTPNPTESTDSDTGQLTPQDKQDDGDDDSGTGTSGTPAHSEQKQAPKQLDASVVAQVDRLCREAQDAFDKEEYKSCRDLMLKALGMIDEDQSQWQTVVDLLGKANIKIFTTDIPVPEKISHTIQSGDTLDSLAKRFNTTIAAIQRSNGIDPQTAMIHPGMQLRVYKGSWRIEVNKSKYRLYLYDGDRLFKVYPVGIGRQDRTPVGTFEVIEKQREPVWYYRGKQFAYGDKENVLGTRWMKIRPTGDTDKSLRGYGIHGTWDPASIGHASSNGCIRLENDNVNELFDIVPKYSMSDDGYVSVKISE